MRDRSRVVVDVGETVCSPEMKNQKDAYWKRPCIKQIKDSDGKRLLKCIILLKSKNFYVDIAK